MKRFLLLAVAVAAFGGSWVAWSAWKTASQPAPLRTARLVQRDLTRSIKVTGVVEPRELVHVGAETTGLIVGFGGEKVSTTQPIDIGARVAKGSALIHLDRETHEVVLEKAVTALQLADAEVARLQPRVEQAQRNYQRAENLRATNSESHFENATTAYRLAQGELAIMLKRRDLAASAVKEAEMQLRQTVIRSPVDGIVIDQSAKLGQRVGPVGRPLLLLARNLGTMRVRASVNEIKIGKVYVGQPVSFTVDAYRKRKLTGRVEKILLNARVQGNFVSYDVIIAPDQSTETLLPHMTADVSIVIESRKKVWLTPTDSLYWQPDPEHLTTADQRLFKSFAGEEPRRFRRGDKAVIWAPAENGRVRPIPVVVGAVDGSMTEVISQGFKAPLPVVVGTIKETSLARILPNIKTIR